MDTILWPITGDTTTVLPTASTALQSIGYKVSPTEDQWTLNAEVGSAIGRALGGGFVRRNKVAIGVFTGSDGATYLRLEPQMTGMSGGAMGLQRAKKEHEKLRTALGSHLHNAGLTPGEAAPAT